MYLSTCLPVVLKIKRIFIYIVKVALFYINMFILLIVNRNTINISINNAFKYNISNVYYFLANIILQYKNLSKGHSLLA